MPKPLVIAYHLIWTAYGWWLPNDPRGSGSRTVRVPSLAKLGDLHYGRKQQQPPFHEIGKFYNHAEQLLRHDLLPLDSNEVPAVARGLARCIGENHYTCYACALMPNHVHLVIRKHKHTAEEMIEKLRTYSRERVVAEGNRDPYHPVWTAGGWKRFLYDPSSVRGVISYVEKNPFEIGQPVQRWPFVTQYDDWPLHPGHSPNSPYARRLRQAR